MFYNKEEKELLGRYFKYIREKQSIKLNDVIKEGICDYKTYKLIENGTAIKSDDIYDGLIEFYNLRIGNLNILMDILDNEIKSLYDAIEWYDNDKISEIIDQIMNCLRFRKENLFLELFESIKYVEKSYVLSIHLDEKEILNSIHFIELWNNKLSSILIEICAKSNQNMVLSNDIFKKLSNILNNDYRISKYWNANDNILQMNYSKATKMFEELYESFKKDNNSIRMINCMMRLYHIYRDTDEEKSSETTKIIECILKENELPNNIVKSIHYSLGMYYYFKFQYQQALLHFEKHYYISKNFKSLLFIFACKSRLNILDEFNVELDDNHVLFPYLNYFKMKSYNNSIILEDYILNTVTRSLKNEKYEEPLWSMFRYELKELIKHTKRYKSLYIYEEKFQKATKNCD